MFSKNYWGQRKPPPGYRINRSHPLAPTQAFLFSEGAGTRVRGVARRQAVLVQSSDSSLNSAGWGRTKFGVGLNCQNGTYGALADSTSNTGLDDLFYTGSNAVQASIVAWVQRGPTAGWGIISNKIRTISPGDNGWDFQFRQSTGALRFAVNQATAALILETTVNLPAQGVWTQIAVVVTDLSYWGFNHLYVNGTEVTYGANSATGIGGQSTDAGTACQIGYPCSPVASFFSSLDGKIDHIAFWKGRALRQEHIRELYLRPFTYVETPRTVYTKAQAGMLWKLTPDVAATRSGWNLGP